jgi:uncharacterized protein (DUF4213/DUF364 family)
MFSELLREVPERKQQQKIRRVVLGLGYIAVEVEGSGVGLCANILHEEKASCTVFPRAGSLKGSRVSDLLDLGLGGDLLNRSIALAAVNAVSNQEKDSGLEEDVFETVAVREGERVVMVGFIAPVAAMLETKGCTVDIFEHRRHKDARIRPHEAMEESLSRADIAIVTATSIINGSLPDILACRNDARAVILMGPSTPMLPRVFSSTPVTFLAGCRVVDAEKAMGIVMEGGGTKVLYKNAAMKKIIREIKR